MTGSGRLACLTGTGAASELMAEALSVLEAAACLSGFWLEQVQAAFGGLAAASLGRRLPLRTREAVLGADAVLVAGAEEPALAELMAELDLRARLTRVRFGERDDLLIVSALQAEALWSVERAFCLAEARGSRLCCVGEGGWCELVETTAFGHERVRVEHLSPRVALPLAAFDAGRFDVVAVAPAWAETMVEIAAAPAAARVAAHALLAAHGPSLFVPSPDGGFALAGQGVVDPGSMLLAAALVLEYGFGRPAAAQALAGAVSAALVDRPRLPRLLGRTATTREFSARVLAGFELSLRNAELSAGAA